MGLLQQCSIMHSGASSLELIQVPFSLNRIWWFALRAARAPQSKLPSSLAQSRQQNVWIWTSCLFSSLLEVALHQPFCWAFLVREGGGMFSTEMLCKHGCLKEAITSKTATVPCQADSSQPYFLLVSERHKLRVTLHKTDSFPIQRSLQCSQLHLFHVRKGHAGWANICLLPHIYIQQEATYWL